MPIVINGVLSDKSSTFPEAIFPPVESGISEADVNEIVDLAVTASNSAVSAAAATATAAQTAAATSASSASTSATNAAASAGIAGSGAATTLLYPALSKALATQTDIVDVMVYDTRQDSDGGAWRFKCEHTSWYQEALNTSTRGARREFPAVVAIVLRSGSTNTLAIYDLTDLDVSGVPRMWAIFAGTFGVTTTINVPSAVFALNGRVWIAFSGTSGRFFELCFPLDNSTRHSINVARVNGLSTATWASATSVVITAIVIVDRNCNHVHARVLPGAALDAAGLPIPTVAVATAGGVSIIHPNGAVYDITSFSGTTVAKVNVGADGFVYAADGQANRYDFSKHVMPYADMAASAGRLLLARAGGSVGSSNPPLLNTTSGLSITGITPFAVGMSNGLAFLAEDVGNPGNSMVSHATIAYATGWMPGADLMRLATLCDATTGNITGSAELVTNGNFATNDLTGWTDASLGTGTANASGGSASLVRTDSSNRGIINQSITTVIGQTYLVVFDVGSNPVNANVGTASTGAQVATNSAVAVGNGQFFQFTATSTTSHINFSPTNTATTSTVDNVSVKLAIPDRSYKGKGLIPVGTLSRTAVATGSDMVAFSGFSAANYLTQPYNADFDFGTGDFSISMFVNLTGQGHILDRRVGAWGYRVFATSGAVSFIIQADTGGGSATVVTTSTDFYTRGWTRVDAVKRGSVIEIWVNGVREATASAASVLTLNAPSVQTIIGNSSVINSPAAGSIAMLRLSAYAPTPAQIARMYRDEAPLFQANAKCFIGGTSFLVADMDFDSARNSLLVGTADGTSEFSGLVRTAYFDTASVPGSVLTNDVMKAVASQAGFRVLAGGAQAVAYREAVNGMDAMNRSGTRGPERFVARGRTTDATPTNLAPRVFVGERELVRFKMRVIGKMVGSPASERFGTVIDCQAYRDAGGNVTFDIAAANQKLARWNGSAAIENTAETTSTMEAVFVADTASQTVAVQVTGKAATVIVWRAEIVGTITRESEGDNYAA